jgi:hypothetical protein
MIEYSHEGYVRRTLNIFPIYRARAIKTLSGSQYLKTTVEATTEHLRLTHLPLLKHQSYSTTSAPKLSQSYPTYAPSRKIDVVTPEILATIHHVFCAASHYRHQPDVPN